MDMFSTVKQAFVFGDEPAHAATRATMRQHRPHLTQSANVQFAPENIFDLGWSHAPGGVQCRDESHCPCGVKALHCLRVLNKSFLSPVITR